MKKTLIIASLILFVVPFSLFASGTDLFSTDSPVWKAASSLCMANGTLPPSSVSPCTAADIESALSRIPPERLDSDERAMLGELLSLLTPGMVLEGEHVSLDARATIAPEIYAQTVPLEKAWDSLWGIKDMMSNLTLNMRMRLGTVGYAFGDWIFLSSGLADQWGKNFGTNTDMLNEFQHEAIFNGGVLLGNDFVNGGVYRSRQEMGYGKTGNLMVGDNFSRQDYARFSVRSEWFDYTLNFTHFDSAEPLSSPNGEITFSNEKFNGMQQSQAVHRFEAKILDRLQITFQEGAMINSSSGFDIRFISPFIFLHGLNNYTESPNYRPGESYDEANNYVASEIGWSVVPHLRLNLQVLMDQIQLSGENDGNPDRCPQAYAVLFNVESPFIRGRHYIDPWYELVMVMPATYLNLKKLPDGNYDTNLDMITGYRNKFQDEVGYAGYTWGSDSVVNALGVSWGIPGAYDMDFSFTWLMHGMYGLGYETVIPARGPGHFSDLPLAGVGFENAEHRFVLELDATYEQLDYLKIKAGIGWLSVLNLGCEKGKTLHDLQFRLGVAFDPVAIWY